MKTQHKSKKRPFAEGSRDYHVLELFICKTESRNIKDTSIKVISQLTMF
jgi:hypothetical protein